TADRLREADQIRCNAVQPRDSARPDRQTGLDLVEGQRGAVRVQSLAQPGEVAGVGVDDAGVHHDRLDDHAGDLAGVGLEHAVDGVQVVEPDQADQVADGLGDTGVAGDPR